MTNNLSLVKTRIQPFIVARSTNRIDVMELCGKAFGDIAFRLRWHRELVGLTQAQYAQKIGVKRAALNNWESGDYRLSLDGALRIRKVYGVSLDFMYEGVSDALDMTLRAAWSERS